MGSSPDLDRLLQQVLGSFSYSNPVNFVIYIITIWAIMKGKINRLPKIYPLLLWLSLPLILVLFWTSMFSETLPHWSGPAYLSLMLLAACWLDEKKESAACDKWLRAAAWLNVSVILIGVTAVLYLPFRIGSTDEKNLGKGDITLDMYGWHSFAVSFDSLYRADLASGHMKENATILSDYWFPAAHLDHYYGIPYHHNLLALGPVNDIHHFAWLNRRRSPLKKHSDAYFIYPSNYYGPPKVSLINDFALVEDSLIIPQYRSGNPVRYFVVYRMHDFKGDSLEWAVPGIH
jgi:hypothetical protein